MNCVHCQKHFDRPLELFDGKSACPKCHAELVREAGLALTDSGEALFRLSEICYLRALKTPFDRPAEYRRDIHKAVDFCREAASTGHPKALLRLGFYYDRGYVVIDPTEAFKKACECYKSVWSGVFPDMRKASAAMQRDYTAESVTRLRTSAAQMYLQLLENTPPSLKQYACYRYDTEAAAVREAGLYDLTDGLADPVPADVAERAEEVLSACLEKGRAPTAGLLSMDGEAFRRLASVEIKTRGGVRSRLAKLAEKVYLCIFDAHSGDYKELKTEKDFDWVAADGAYRLYFFNTAGGHRLPGGALTAIRKTLAQNDFARLEPLVRDGDTDYVFFDDDFIRFKSRLERWSHAAGELLAYANNKQ